VISRYGESTTVSGTGMRRSFHSSTSAAVSAGSTCTVTAVSECGRVACANARARMVGSCKRLTGTIARMRLGSVTPAGLGTSSAATRE
jgi:hypothetical protein